jgi:hypothetical protein
LRKSLLFAAIFIVFLFSSGNANAGHIYLLRGLAGIFSTGLDILDQKLIQRGFTATVHGHLDYEELASEAARLQKSGKGPIIIMGHSLGADAAIFMADKMKSLGAPVALVVTFGPTMNLVAHPIYPRSSITIPATRLLLRVPASGARFPMWISMEPLTSIISMLRRAIASMPALSQKFRQSLAADVPYSSRDKAEQARLLPYNEHARLIERMVSDPSNC